MAADASLLLIAVGRLRHRSDLDLIQTTFKSFSKQTHRATHTAAISLRSNPAPTATFVKKMRRFAAPAPFYVADADNSVVRAALADALGRVLDDERVEDAARED